MLPEFGDLKKVAKLLVKFTSKFHAWFCCIVVSYLHNGLPANFVICTEILVQYYLSILTATFPSEPGLDGFIEAKDVRNGGDNWSYET